jgi:hypothetical protein
VCTLPTTSLAANKGFPPPMLMEQVCGDGEIARCGFYSNSKPNVPGTQTSSLYNKPTNHSAALTTHRPTTHHPCCPNMHAAALASEHGFCSIGNLPTYQALGTTHAALGGEQSSCTSQGLYPTSQLTKLSAAAFTTTHDPCCSRRYAAALSGSPSHTVRASITCPREKSPPAPMLLASFTSRCTRPSSNLDAMVASALPASGERVERSLFGISLSRRKGTECPVVPILRQFS